MKKDILGYDEKFLVELRDLIKNSEIEELEIEDEEKYIRISKRTKETKNQPLPVYQYTSPTITDDTSFEVTSNIKTESPKKEVKELVEANVESLYNDETKYYKVKSPLVGTFYEAPSPSSPPFVKLGDVVLPDTTVCIVEAMKVMNEIKAEVKGKIVKIMKTNASPVNANDVLFIIEKM